MSTPPMPPGPQGPQAPQPQGQPYPQAPQGQAFPPPPPGQQPFPGQPQPFPGQQQPFQGGGAVPPGPVPGTGPMPGQPQPFPPAPMGTPPKKRRGVLASILGVVGVILVVIIVRVVIGLGVSTAVNSADDAHNTNVGDCASVTGTTTKPSYSKVDCGSGKENYTIGMVIKASESCPADGGYDEYYEEGTLNNVKLCLAPVFKDGQCYNITSSQTSMGYPSLACTDPSAIQVKVVKDKADKNACQDPTSALAYTPLKLTYCLTKPSGS